MEPNNNLRHQEAVVRHILELAENIYRALNPALPLEWLSADLTVAQLRVLLVLFTDGPSRMSSIASYLGIALSTATGIVDNLVKKGLVSRGAAPDDRRLVICELSPQGRELVSNLWQLSRFQIERLLVGLTPVQLDKAAEVAELLLANVRRQEAAEGQAHNGGGD